MFERVYIFPIRQISACVENKGDYKISLTPSPLSAALHINSNYGSLYTICTASFFPLFHLSSQYFFPSLYSFSVLLFTLMSNMKLHTLTESSPGVRNILGLGQYQRDTVSTAAGSPTETFTLLSEICGA